MLAKILGPLECVSVELNMHPDRQFSGLFVVHMPSCLHVLLCVTRPLCSLGGGDRHFGYVPLEV